MVENPSDIDKFKSFAVSEEVYPAQTAPQPSVSKEVTPPPKESSSHQKVSPSKALEVAEAQKPLSEPERVFASPFARKVAGEMGVSLHNIKGTGPNGRIINADVMASVSTMKSKPLSPSDTFSDLPLSNMRKV